MFASTGRTSRIFFYTLIIGLVLGQVTDPITVAAFQSLYKSTGGPRWKQSTNWNNGTDVCTFSGVTCNGSVIVEVDLSFNNLRGSNMNTSWISRSPNMRSVNITGNSLTGPLPAALNYAGLKVLDIGGNQFNGMLPSLLQSSLQTFIAGELERQSDDLTLADGNDFSGILPYLPKSSIQHLSVSGNNLKGGVTDLRWFPRLITADLSDTSMRVKPNSTLNQLQNLLFLNVSGVKLAVPVVSLLTLLPPSLLKLDASGSGLSGDLDNMTGVSLVNLMYLDVSDNGIGGVSIDISGLPNLSFFNASLNALSGDISGLSKNANLQVLDLRANQLQGSLYHLERLNDLQYLDVSSNVFNGAVPNLLSNFDQMNFLSLSKNALTGPLVPGIVALPRLAYLDVSFNLLSGNLPDEWSSPLQGIILASNQFSGNIPESIFSNLNESLTALVLAGNLMSGNLSPNISKLTQLTDLILAGNEFSGDLPSSLPPNLTTFSGIFNLFSGNIPTSICSPSLTTIDLSHNNFTGEIPSCIGEMNGLINLNLQENELSGPLPNVTSMTSLQTLILSDNNKLNGSISDLSSLYNLTALDLSDNDFSGEMFSVASMPQLVLLDLSFNDISGAFPDVSGLKNLQRIDVSNNQLTGTVPGYATSLMYIDVSHNHFNYLDSGSFDNTLNLQYLDVSYNQIYAPIPTGAGSKNLQILKINNNQFRGSIVAGLQLLESMTYMDTSNNLLTGNLPYAFNLVTHMQYANLSNNSLSGTLPAITLHELTVFDISRNNFSGKIPIDWPPQMVSLNLAGNQFSGEIPPQILSIRDLLILDVSNNQLRGEISNDLGDTSRLTQLDVSNNHLNGTYPSQLAAIRSLTSLNISFNQFSGALPTIASDPYIIDVSSNEFMGDTNWLSSGTSLRYLNASHNGFDSMTTFYTRKRIEVLDMSDNDMEGRVPDLTNCGSLTYLNLSGNQLTGDLSVTSDALKVLDVSDNELSTADGTFIGRNTTLCLMTSNHLECPLPWFVFYNCQTTCVASNTSSTTLRLRIAGQLDDFQSDVFLRDLNSITNTSHRFSIIDTSAGSVIVDMSVTSPPSKSINEGSANRIVELLLQKISQNATAYTSLYNITFLPGSQSPVPSTTIPPQPQKFPVAAIIGIAVGATVVLVLFAALLLFLVFRRRPKKDNSLPLVQIDMSNIQLGAAKKSLIPYAELKGLAMVGAGANGIVYRAQWREMTVAVKQIRAEHINQDQLKSFLSEVAILQGLRAHPNVVMFIGEISVEFRLITLGMTFPPDPLSMVTEFCESGSLYNFLRANPVTWEKKIALIQGIALGMLHLHLEKVIHRDLAVRNILLTKHLEPKVSDFGLSREQQSDTAEHTTNDVGPLKWMAPEVQNPWDGVGPVEAAISVATKGQRLTIPQDADPSVKKLIEMCWEAEPDQRPDFKDICRYLGVERSRREETLSYVPTPHESNVTMLSASTLEDYNILYTSVPPTTPGSEDK
ncbi:putative leucine-rich repeat receptor-like protein kinase [Planoprotostelium fungivorum]|uniref:Putative leucine-rich repeat receptor-like protein kinase n=1 Tax=Planoprotostelium fungivorum TaxID=1890364 RepID=A0A2P6MUC9_9EUKA|nr:putative leucine-rich repeat receptor-like protein kinase [Planoprotostelium fungivorum]